MSSDEVDLQLLLLEMAVLKDLILVLSLEEGGLVSLDPFDLVPTRTATYINVSSLNLCGGWIGAVMPPIVELANVGKGSTLTSGA